MNKNIALSLAAAATMLAGGAAYAQAAQTTAQTTAQTGQTMQRGADMTRAQVAERADAAFARMDINNDGVIDAADREARQRTRFDQIDTNNNGTIEFAEFTAQRSARGERTGAQREGQRGERRSEMRGQRGEGAQMGRRGNRGGMGMMGRVSGDGSVTLEQLRASALARFDQMDANNDGTVTAEERRAAREAMRTQRRAAQPS